MSSFPERKIGDKKVACIGYGAMGASAFYSGRVSEEESLKVIRKAKELVGDSLLMIDTADMYGQKMGDNERLLSKILSDPEFRKGVYIATKFGNYADEQGNRSIRGSAEYVRSAIEKSLNDLGLDYVDLYYQHRVDRTVDIAETWNELKKLKEAGKVKALGISEATSEEIRKAHAIVKIDALQIELSPWTPQILSNGILDTCRELGITVVAYSPLGRGFLTGAYTKPEDFPEDDFRRHNPRFQGEAFKENLKLVDELKAQADKKKATPGQLALAWCLALGDDIIPIPGTKKEKYLIENMEAAKIKLDSEELKSINAIIEKANIIGDRYPAAFNKAGAF